MQCSTKRETFLRTQIIKKSPHHIFWSTVEDDIGSSLKCSYSLNTARRMPSGTENVVTKLFGPEPQRFIKIIICYVKMRMKALNCINGDFQCKCHNLQ